MDRAGPQAIKSGLSPQTIEAPSEGRYPHDMPADESVALDFTWQLLRIHGVADPTYQAAQSTFGDASLVELTTLVGFLKR